MKKKTKKEVKYLTMTVRLTEDELKKIKRACNRDEIKHTLFAYEKIMEGVDDLIKQQEVRGFQCMNPL